MGEHPLAQLDYRRYVRPIEPSSNDALAVVASLIRPGAEVLDVGCSAGLLGLLLAKDQTIRVDGVDCDGQALERAKGHYRKVRLADLERDDVATLTGGGTYDVVVLADVIEHLRDPRSVLARIRPALKSGGQLIISTPHVGYVGVVAELLHGDFTYRPTGILDETHLRFFTRSSLK